MAFDISTARPSTGSGFDLSTARQAPEQKPVDQPESMTKEQFASKFGDIPDIEGLMAPQAPSPEPTIGEKIVGAGEAALTVGTGITGGTVGALGGTLKGVIDEIRSGEFGTSEAANRIADKAADLMQELTYAPRTEAGQEITKSIGEVGEALAPLSGLGGQVAQLGQATKAAVPGLKAQAAIAGKAAAPAIKSGKEITTGIFQRQSPTKQRIANLIKEGSTDVETAKFELKKPKVTISPGGTSALDAPTTAPTSRLRQALDIEGPKIQKDVRAVETIKQGFDEGVIAAVKAASPADKSKMLKMVDVMEQGKKNKRFAAQNRPSDIAGNTLMDRFRVIRSANKSAGKEIDKVAQTLKGKPIDLKGAADGFSESLDNLGVRLIGDGKGGLKPDFELSQLSPGDRGPIKEIIRQMNISGRGDVDGFAAHRMKKIIDNNVSFGKVKTGLGGEAERALKSFRKDIDGALDKTFPDYDKVNTIYSETIGAIDSLQKVAGGKMNLIGDNVDSAVGTLLRRVMSNAQSRVNLIDSIDEIEKVARKHGAGSKLMIEGAGLGGDDLLNQILFVDELDSVFGPVARTSLAGEVGKEIKRGAQAARGGAFDFAVDVAAKGVEKARGINEQAAFKSIKELLKK